MSAIRTTENTVQYVKTYLNSHHMLAYESWISECVQYFVANAYTLTEIKDNAYQQWLMHDLKYICPGSLPENLAQLDKTILNGKFVLQMNSFMDISISKYQQYQKMKKIDIENIQATMNPEEKISSKRMLKFELTDGKQTIYGIEYNSISKLKVENIFPGCKFLIKGPVQFKQGILLLKDSSVEFLGGEVENMLETHSLAAQLTSELNLPLIENSNEPSPISHTTNGDIRGKSNVTLNTGVTDVGNIHVSHSNPTRSSFDTLNNYRREVNSITTLDLVEKRQIETEPAPKKIKLEEPIDEDDSERFAEEDLRAIEECERLHSSDTLVISSEPFVYLKQINELSESEKSGRVFQVKAQIQNVRTRLAMTQNREWSLECTIIDGTGSMDVEFSSEILSRFLQYTPEKISELKKTVATNPNFKQDFNLACVKTAETLRTLYCIMELTMFALPKITRLIEFEDFNAELIEKRLNQQSVALKISLR